MGTKELFERMHKAYIHQAASSADPVRVIFCHPETFRNLLKNHLAEDEVEELQAFGVRVKRSQDVPENEFEVY